MEKMRSEHNKDAKKEGDYSYKSSTYKSGKSKVSKISSKSNPKVIEKVE